MITTLTHRLAALIAREAPSYPPATRRRALAEVRDLLGHASIQMTERYAHLAPGATRGAVDRLANSGHTALSVVSADCA